MPGTRRLLATVDLTVDFDGLRAVDHVSLEVAHGEMVGLIGPNGAGKTTLVDAVTGFAASTGRVLLEGVDISAFPPHVRARSGLARTWQSLELFDDLTVAEHIDVAVEPVSVRGVLRGLIRGSDATVPRLGEILELLGLTEMADRKPPTLSPGQRKLVGLARALAPGARVLLLDEPAAGLDEDETRLLALRLRAVVDRGTSALLIDHDMSLVMSTCDRVYVLDFGEVIARGLPDEVRVDRRVIAAYLGDALVGGAAPGPTPESSR